MSTDDAWAVREQSQPGRTEDGVAAEAIGKQREPDHLAWLIAGALFLCVGAAQLAMLFVRTSIGSTSQMLYDSLAFDVVQGLRSALFLGCGMLLINRRTREAACGIALSAALIADIRYFWKLRPSTVTREYGAIGAWLSGAVFVLQSAGAVAVLVLLIRRRTARGARQRRTDRIVALLLGFTGAVLWATSNPLAWYRIRFGSASGYAGRTDACCSWTQVDSWDRVAIVLGGLSMIVLAFVAATVRAKARAAGLLFGMALVPLGDVAWSITSSIAPMPSFYGFHYRQYLSPSVTVTDTPMPGFWIALIGVVLIAAAGACRLLLGSREERYLVPELTGAGRAAP
ncbi:MAG TPA: hypothetical protein VFU74_01795 [Actinocrinis sp.]|nr:hypothetical protein [Actinocrinis sp.]